MYFYNIGGSLFLFFALQVSPVSFSVQCQCIWEAYNIKWTCLAQSRSICMFVPFVLIIHWCKWQNRNRVQNVGTSFWICIKKNTSIFFPLKWSRDGGVIDKSSWTVTSLSIYRHGWLSERWNKKTHLNDRSANVSSGYPSHLQSHHLNPAAPPLWTRLPPPSPLSPYVRESVTMATSP